MEDNQNSSVVKVLVDVLSASLQNLSEKINSIQPILSNVNSNIDKQITEINKILFDTQSISKSLDTSIADFYTRTNAISENLNNIKIKIEELSRIDSTIEKFNVEFKKFTDELNNTLIQVNFSISELKKEIQPVNCSISELKKEIQPVIKLANWITTPIGIIIFIVGLIFASITIVNGVRSVVEYFHTTTQTVNQSNLSNDSNK